MIFNIFSMLHFLWRHIPNNIPHYRSRGYILRRHIIPPSTS
nr:MAG TPA: hypothetical protein [Bacteriophage sp.]